VEKKEIDESGLGSVLDDIIGRYETELSRLESVIKKAEFRKVEIADLLRTLSKERGMFSAVQQPPQVASRQSVRSPALAVKRPGVHPSLSAVILDLLRKEPNRNFTSEHIIAETGFKDHKTTRSTLARLYREGRIDKPSRALYRAKSSDGKARSTFAPEESKPVPARIAGFLSLNKGRSFRVTEMAEAMRDVNIKTLRAAILRLEASGKISQTGRGTYRAGDLGKGMF
jgi:hypothetical protein